MLLQWRDKISVAFKAIFWLATLIADAYTAGALLFGIYQDLLPEEMLKVAFVLLFLLLVLLYSFMKILSYSNQLNLLYQLSARGHLHSMRMVLLVDKERKKEKQQLKADHADFNFEIGSREGDRSSMVYNHRFYVWKKKFGAITSPAWIFGDMDIKPEDAEYTIRGSTWKKTKPRIEDIAYNEVSAHNGIYKFEWNFDSDAQRNKVEVDLRYVRKAAFPWNRNHILIIYPDCYFKDIKEASFSVMVGHNEIEQIEGVNITEINGARIPRDTRNMDKSILENGGYTFKTGEYIEVHKGSVYIITVKVKH